MPAFILHLGLILLGSAVTSACHTDFADGGNYSVSPIDNDFWLNSGPFSFVLNGTRRSTDDSSLSVFNHTSATGVDAIGQYSEDKWILNAGNITMEAAIRTYPDISLPIVVYIQRFPQGLSGARTNVTSTITSFPSFLLQDSSPPLGYLSYGSIMFGDHKKRTGIWGPRAHINDGLDGSGPLVIFDGSGNAMLLSPLDNFMSASMWQDKSKGTLNYGIMGGVDSLPASFEYSTVAFCSTTGVGDAFEGWGRLMRRVYNKTDEVRDHHQLQDLSLTHLGYRTDNGAYYFYNTEQGKNYEDTLLDAKKDWTNRKIPYKYLEIDSWFYPKDSSSAVTSWDAREDIFPQGMRAFGEKIDLPIIAHNRYWSVNTTYAKLRGGFFDFVTGNLLSLPNEEFFWEFLIGHATVEWGLIVYEQDHLNEQFLNSEFLTSDLYLSRTWLTQMGTAAANHGIKIEYCMALPRQGYQSLEIPTVTQARVSNDYHSDSNQWRIGVTSHFASAMGVAPSKDTFWTTSSQPGNTYGKLEPYPTLQVVVATLSRGPVGPGDMIGGTNASILLRCCDESGLILKPSKPARAIDDQITEMAFGNNSGVSGEIWTTHSKNGDLLYGVIFAAALTRDYVISPQSAGFLSQFAHNFTDSVIYSSGNKTLFNFTAESNFTISANQCSTNGEPFCLFYTAPVILFGSRQVVLLGDLNKWVPMSENRVSRVWQTGAGIAVTLSGAPAETISFTFAIDGVFFENSQQADQVGCATFSVISSEFGHSMPEDANMTTTTATTWKPTLPPGYDCRFKPPVAA